MSAYAVTETRTIRIDRRIGNMAGRKRPQADIEEPRHEGGVQSSYIEGSSTRYALEYDILTIVVIDT